MTAFVDDRKGSILQAAIRLLEAGGPEAVQARKLASEIGASTMAIYTHFGGMAELFEAMIREGFVRFAAHVASVVPSEDPMADFFVHGMAYRQWALANPQLYRLIFGMSDASLLRRVAQDMTLAGTISLLPEGEGAFRVMTDSLERIKHSKQIAEVDTVAAAGQFLAATHGYVLLEMAGYFAPEGQSFATVLGPMAINLMVGLGAQRETVDRAITAALIAVGIN
ncbi:MAG: TetR/AcrR family transcriptional regulator [Acidimicrobiales bacterium]